MRVREVRVRVPPTKVRERDAVLNRRLRKTELLNKDGATVGSRDSVEAVEEDGGSLVAGRGRRVEVRLDLSKVKDGAEEVQVVGDRVDNLDLEGAGLDGANLLEIDLGRERERQSLFLLRPRVLLLTSGRAIDLYDEMVLVIS